SPEWLVFGTPRSNLYALSGLCSTIQQLLKLASLTSGKQILNFELFVRLLVSTDTAFGGGTGLHRIKSSLTGCFELLACVCMLPPKSSGRNLESQFKVSSLRQQLL